MISKKEYIKACNIVVEYEKIMNTLTPLLVADRLKEIKAEFDKKFKNQTK